MVEKVSVGAVVVSGGGVVGEGWRELVVRRLGHCGDGIKRRAGAGELVPGASPT